MQNVDQKVIDQIFDEWEFPYPVKDSNGWEQDEPNVLTRTVFLEVDPEEPSEKGTFKIELGELPLSRQPYLCAAFDFHTRTGRFYDLQGNVMKPHFSEEELAQ